MNDRERMEEAIKHHRDKADVLQKRLSARRQECVALGKDLFRATESARIANEVADATERQLKDLQIGYDTLMRRNINLSVEIMAVHNRSLWDGMMYRLGKLVAKLSQEPDEPYGC